MTDKEVKMIVGSKAKEKIYTKSDVLKPSKSGFLMYDLIRQPCRNLMKDLKCKVHNKDDRPRVCKDYPIFIFKNYVMPAQTCPAVNEGLLDEYIKKIEEFGYKKI